MAPAHFSRSNDGAVAVEMAFVAPLFVTLLFGIHDFGTVFVEALELEHAIQAGAEFTVDYYNKYGTADATATQNAVTGSTPLPVAVSIGSLWCGTPNASATAITNKGSPPCASGNALYVTINGTAATARTFGRWIGFPGTLSLSRTRRLTP